MASNDRIIVSKSQVMVAINYLNLADSLGVTLLPLGREGLINMMRHARARNCLIRLTVNGGLQLEIVVDGARPSERSTGSIELALMRECAAETASHRIVEERPGGGVRVQTQLAGDHLCAGSRFGTRGTDFSEVPWPGIRSICGSCVG